MRRTLTRLLLAGGLLWAVGCGGQPKPNTEPMTEEEVRKMQEEDRQIDDAERAGSGTATGKKKK
jgi:hypothetical protein